MLVRGQAGPERRKERPWLASCAVAACALPLRTNPHTATQTQEVIAAGSAVAASRETPFDPASPHVERLRAWWTALLGRALGQEEQLAGAMALSVFAGSFEADAAASILKVAVPGCDVARLLKFLPVLSVLQDASMLTGEGSHLGARLPPPCWPLRIPG